MRTIITDVTPFSHIPFEKISLRVVDLKHVHAEAQKDTTHFSLALPTAARQFWDIDATGRPKWLWGRHEIGADDKIIMLGSRIVEITKSVPVVDDTQTRFLESLAQSVCPEADSDGRVNLDAIFDAVASLKNMDAAVKKLLDVSGAADISAIVGILDGIKNNNKKWCEQTGSDSIEDLVGKYKKLLEDYEVLRIAIDGNYYKTNLFAVTTDTKSQVNCLGDVAEYYRKVLDQAGIDNEGGFGLETVNEGLLKCVKKVKVKKTIRLPLT